MTNHILLEDNSKKNGRYIDFFRNLLGQIIKFHLSQKKFILIKRNTKNT